ncbi:response regulator transcription factor [Paenibacillus ferrarius]|uniref:response regulator transcription factor n=1 Tax=Paenibacillus ferrarius TaxID=1469647 RepID=UPI003D2DFCEA
MDTRILLVEDDPDICDLVAIYLRNEGMRVDVAMHAEQALALFQQSVYHLVVSDIMLPGMDGMQFVKQIRRHSDLPVIFLTSKKEPQDIITGLQIGGDDYVTKPFEPEVLVARVLAGLRRYRTATAPEHSSGGDVWNDGWLTVHKNRLEVLVDNKPIALPAKELQLLLMLLERPSQVFSVNQIYERIWGLDGISDERTVMVHIHNLRKKIEKAPAHPVYIKTIRGFGYTFGGLQG